jgi:hypothetical protein
VLRIRDVYPGSDFFPAGFRIDRIPDTDPKYDTVPVIIIWNSRTVRITVFHLAFCSLSKLCKSAPTGLQTFQGSILSLDTSTVSVYGHPQLHIEPSQLLNFYLNDSYAAFDLDADLDPLPKMINNKYSTRYNGSFRIRNAGEK